MTGAVHAIYRHPVKGFTPEPLTEVALTPGHGVPFDRVYAVEDGPSGFDPHAPAHISKQRFTVLAKIPEVARIRTQLDDATGILSATAPNAAAIRADLATEVGRTSFADWLAGVLGESASGPLRVLPAPGRHRFYDDPEGYVSLINLATLRDIARHAGREIDPLRFRANLYIEGWPAWRELELEGQRVRIGDVTARVHRAIPRCIATHVDTKSGVRDLDMLDVLRRGYDHRLCGIYLHVEEGGALRVGDAATAL